MLFHEKGFCGFGKWTQSRMCLPYWNTKLSHPLFFGFHHNIPSCMDTESNRSSIICWETIDCGKGRRQSHTTVQPVCHWQTWCRLCFHSPFSRSDSRSEIPHSVIKEPGIRLNKPAFLCCTTSNRSCLYLHQRPFNTHGSILNSHTHPVFLHHGLT